MRRFTLLICGLFLAGAVQAQTTTMLDVTGFLYEEDNTPGEVGFLPSNPGDVLAGIGFIEGLGPEIDWDPSLVELTWVFYDLVSTGEMDLGNGMFYTAYLGGSLDIVADAYAGGGYTAGDYSVEPPNATAPATFADGEVYLHGDFTNFFVVFDPVQHSGYFEGYLTFTGGTEFNELAPNPHGYTFAGNVDPMGAPVPDGYDLEAVGHITFDPEVPTTESTWGQVKNLYR